MTTTLACHRQLVYLYVDSSTVKKIRHEKWFHLFIILCQKLLQKFKYHARILIFYVQKWVATDDKRIEAMKTRVDIIQEAQAQPKSNFNSSKKKRKKKKSKPKKSPPVIEIDASSSHDRGSNLEMSHDVVIFWKKRHGRIFYKVRILCASTIRVAPKIVLFRDPSVIFWKVRILCASAKRVAPKIVWIRVPFKAIVWKLSHGACTTHVTPKIRSQSQSPAKRLDQH